MKFSFPTESKKHMRFGLILLSSLIIGLFFTVLNPNKPSKPKKDPYAGLFTRKGNQEINISTLLQNKAVPVLKLSNDREKTVKLSKLSITSVVENGVAKTRYDMHFYNHLDRDLEAELQFPLADGQTISYFAMDVNGEMRPGVAVEKIKARIAYEATVRQGIDPGLIEKTQGNNFKLRVFPVLAKGTKHIVIEYMHELAMDVKNTYYYLPLYFKEKIPSFSYSLSIVGEAENPNILRSCSEDFKLSEVAKIYQASFRKMDFLANKPIIIQLPNQEKKTVAACEQKATGVFFHTNLVLPQKYARKKLPKKITVLWDVSSSRFLSQIPKEISLLKNYLRSMKNGKVELIPFGYKSFDGKTFTVKNGQSKELIAAIKQLEYDGGTTLNQLPWNTCKGEEILVFTDGLQNLGSAVGPKTSKEIYCIQSAIKSDNGFLKNLSRTSHGEFIDLCSLTEKEALERLNSKSLHFMGFEADASLDNYYPSTGLGNNGILSVSGKLNKARPYLTAKFGIGTKVLLKTRISLDDNRQKAHANLEKMWAIHQLNELQENSKQNEEQILETGLKYRLVSDFTSMLILDRVEDYVQHRILPPKSLQKEYYKQLKIADKEAKKDQFDHLRNIKKEWKVQQAWWKTHRKERKKKQPRSITHRAPMPQDEVELRSETTVGALNDRSAPPPPPAQEVSANSTEQMLAFLPPVVEDDENTESFTSTSQLGVDMNLSVTGAATYSWTNTAFETNGFSSSLTSPGTYSLSVTNVNGVSTTSVVNRGTLKLKAWDPKSPYMKRIKSVPLSKAYSVYLEERKKYASQPSFYLDVSDYLIFKKHYTEGIRVLSNIAELDLENHSLLRIVAQRFLQLGEKKLAVALFKHLIEIRPEEPQSYRDLGLAFEQIGNYNEAIRYLYKVVKEPYDGRFAGIHCIALNEINNIIAQHPRNLNYAFIDKAFIKKMPVDIRIVLNWDTDDTDVDLWVTEPDGEKCMYSYPLTANGGRISNDFTQGYGPEEYMIHAAKPGTYHIQAHYYGDHRATVNGKATLSIQLFKQYGTSFQYKREITRRLNVTEDIVDLGEFEF
ncbi:MAG: VIT domain-containing protein [Flavobacteriia bacterium]